MSGLDRFIITFLLGCFSGVLIMAQVSFGFVPEGSSVATDLSCELSRRALKKEIATAGLDDPKKIAAPGPSKHLSGHKQQSMLWIAGPEYV